MLKKLIIPVLLGALFLLPVPAVKAAYPSVSAQACVLLEERNKQILYEKNAYARLPMASTTKIMTALVILQTERNLDRLVTVPAEAAGLEGSSMYLKAGDKATVKQLLSGMLIVSGNDAAQTLAITNAGSVEAFVEKMNASAKALGLKNTHFKNPSGLPDEEHYTTAYELALITREAFKYDIFEEIVALQAQTVTIGEAARTLVNHNKMLVLYEGSDGVKTGFTKKAGRCLVSSATRDGTRLITVTLNAPSDWADHRAMLDYGFDSLLEMQLCAPGEIKIDIKVTGGVKQSTAVTNISGAAVKTGNKNIKLQKTYVAPNFIYAPVKKGDVIGHVIYEYNGFVYADLPLVATEDIKVYIPVKPPKKNLWDYFKILMSF